MTQIFTSVRVGRYAGRECAGLITEIIGWSRVLPSKPAAATAAYPSVQARARFAL